MFSSDSQKKLLEKANLYLSQISEDNLKLVIDFLAYLQQKEEKEATEELLEISGFERELREAEEELKQGEIVTLQSIYRS
ncbi:MAG: hypothetical protein VKJ02_13720 [Snowella sp.]|nr:hypothetical protein [Snowella sp.]